LSERERKNGGGKGLSEAFYVLQSKRERKKRFKRYRKTIKSKEVRKREKRGRGNREIEKK